MDGRPVETRLVTGRRAMASAHGRPGGRRARRPWAPRPPRPEAPRADAWPQFRGEPRLRGVAPWRPPPSPSSGPTRRGRPSSRPPPSRAGSSTWAWPVGQAPGPRLQDRGAPLDVRDRRRDRRIVALRGRRPRLHRRPRGHRARGGGPRRPAGLDLQDAHRGEGLAGGGGRQGPRRLLRPEPLRPRREDGGQGLGLRDRGPGARHRGRPGRPRPRHRAATRCSAPSASPTDRSSTTSPRAPTPAPPRPSWASAPTTAPSSTRCWAWTSRRARSLWRYEPTERQFPFYSSAAVDGGQVVLGGRDKLVHCLDADTGKALWTFATKGRVDSSPVIAGGRVYVGSADGRVYALDLATGKRPSSSTRAGRSRPRPPWPRAASSSAPRTARSSAWARRPEAPPRRRRGRRNVPPAARDSVPARGGLDANPLLFWSWPGDSRPRPGQRTSRARRRVSLHTRALVDRHPRRHPPAHGLPGFDLGARDARGHVDIPRLREGGLDAFFFSIWVPSKVTGPEAVKRALRQIDAVREQVAAIPPTSSSPPPRPTLRAAVARGRIAALHGHGGRPHDRRRPGAPAHLRRPGRPLPDPHPLPEQQLGRLVDRTSPPTTASPLSARTWCAS